MDTLVLGGSRFVGLHLVQLLHSQRHKVTVLNRGLTRTELPAGVRRLKADRHSPAEMTDALEGKGYDTVFDISGYTADDVEAVLTPLADGIGHYVFCSSTAVYAPSELGPVREDFPLFHAPGARPYARDKVACEDLLMDAHARGRLSVTVVRPPYVYGPHNTLPQREFAYFARLIRGRSLIIPDQGLRHWHSVHVEDLAALFAAVPGWSQALGQAYTACADAAITANGYVQALEEVMGVRAEIVNVDSTDPGLTDGSVFPFGDGASSIYANDKARSDLDWAPNYTMRDGLEMTYRWWREEGLDQEEWDFSKDDEVLRRVSHI